MKYLDVTICRFIKVYYCPITKMGSTDFLCTGSLLFSFFIYPICGTPFGSTY